MINESTPSSVHLSIDHNDELVAASSQATLRSLGVNSCDIVYYSLASSYFSAFDHKLGSSSSTTAQKMVRGKLTETDKSIVSDPMSIEEEPSKGSLVLENVVTNGPEPMEIAGSKRLSEPLFLKKLLMEESGDTCELTIVVMTVHAAMLDSGFVLFIHDPGMCFSFKDQILPISLKYTLPAPLISANGIESVSLKFQRLGQMVLVNGSLGVGNLVRRVCFDQRKYVHVVDLLMGTLKSEEEYTLSIHSKVLMWWRMIKDGLVTPLLIDLHYKSGSELPPCFMCLPQELKRKIMDLLCGANIARLACVSSELRDMASDNDLWKQKCIEEFRYGVIEGINVLVNWKENFATLLLSGELNDIMQDMLPGTRFMYI